MTAELVPTSTAAVTTLTEQMDFSRAVQTAGLLPQAYRGKPADIMLAVGLGQSMGLSPAESLYRIDVIQGKPTASAELIASNVRKAGHVLRLRIDEQAVSATCTIIRADDPDYEHTVTRDKAWAQQMGLLAKDNYKKQPATMLGWRAVTACARMACPEALYGVAYTPDEMWDDRPRVTAVQADAPAPERMAAILGDPPAESEQPAPESITKPQLTKLHTVLTGLGMERDEALAFYRSATGREVDSSKTLTKDEASVIIDTLEAQGGAA